MYILRTLRTCGSNNWNMLFEHLGHVVRTPITKGCAARQRALDHRTHDPSGCSNNMFRVFGQDVLGVRSTCSGCSDNIYRYYCYTYIYLDTIRTI